MGKNAAKRFNAWAVEGEKLLSKLTDAKVVDDIASRVDFDQVSTQVNKLRDQLEDLLATWRSSFRPEKLPAVKIEASTNGVKFDTIPAKKSPSRSSAKNVAVKKTAAKKATGKSPSKTIAKKTVEEVDRQEGPCQEGRGTQDRRQEGRSQGVLSFRDQGSGVRCQVSLNLTPDL